MEYVDLQVRVPLQRAVGRSRCDDELDDEVTGDGHVSSVSHLLE